MNKRTILTAFLVLALTLSMTLGAYAYFTSDSTSTNNNISTGTISIGAPNPGPGNAAIITASGLLPGGSVTNSVSINNLGTSAFKYGVSASNSGDADLYAALTVTVVRAGTTVYSGPFSGLATPVEANSNLAAAGTDSLVFTVALPTTADNTVQGKSVNITFAFVATQTDNPGWDQ